MAVGTDNCALQDEEDYLSELRLAGLLARFDGAGPPKSATRMLDMGTSMGARAIFNPQVGQLEVGMKADLVAIELSRLSGSYLDADTDLLEAVMARGRGADVLMTVVDGMVRYQRGADERRREAAITAAASAKSARSVGDAARRASEEIAEALRKHCRRGEV